MLNNLIKDLERLKNPVKAKLLQRFFKTGKGEYGEGDIFLGIIVPKQRAVAKKYCNLELKDLHKLLDAKIHEYRLVALLILVDKYKRADLADKKTIVNFYLSNTKNINNWDLVDLSAPKIIGPFFRHKGKSTIIKLARSQSLWERRISILATFDYIKENHFKTALRISTILVKDKEDLIQKAVGWMLREVGKKDINVLEGFLEKYVKVMPRTMLRYAIEKMSEKERKKWLSF